MNINNTQKSVLLSFISQNLQIKNDANNVIFVILFIKCDPFLDRNNPTRIQYFFYPENNTLLK